MYENTTHSLILNYLSQHKNALNKWKYDVTTISNAATAGLYMKSYQNIDLCSALMRYGYKQKQWSVLEKKFG